MVYVIQCDAEVPAGLVTRVLEECQLPWQLVRLFTDERLPLEPDVLVILGGRMGVHDTVLHPFLRPLKALVRSALEQGRPVLGICLGGQLLAEAAGGVVTPRHCGERGLVEIRLMPDAARDPYLAGLPVTMQVFAWHEDCFSLPPRALHLAWSTGCPIQAFRIDKALALQFHPEVDAAIVADWCRDDPEALELRDVFVRQADQHAALARQLLQNFFASF